MTAQTAYIVLNTGDVLTGKYLGKPQTVEGEVVFNTSMMGYQEVMTDPSYQGQLVTLTYPLIGNYGINESIGESVAYGASALIIQTPCLHPDHPTSTTSLLDYVTKKQMPVIYDIDTRHLTKLIRKHGNVFGKITPTADDHVQLTQVQTGLVPSVSVRKPISFGEQTEDALHIGVIDYGQKQSIINALLKNDVKVTVFPYDTTKQTLEHHEVDGVLFSNGPGDPMDLVDQLPSVKEISATFPSFGICLGHQLLALSYGCKTEKLPYGHRGGNHPVKAVKTNQVTMTSQNHGFVVAEDGICDSPFEVSYLNVNDGSIEGLKHKDLLIQSVQFHPEANPGPWDSTYIIDEFVQLVKEKGVRVYA